MAKEYQKFSPWTPTGDKDLGDEEWDGRPSEKIWQSLGRRNPELRELKEYRLFTDQRELCWKDLPALKVTALPRVIPSDTRGTTVNLTDLNSVPRPRTVGPLVIVAWQQFTSEKEEFEAPVLVDVPNEITLEQLVADYIFPTKDGNFDIDTQFTWCLEETSGSKKDQTKREVTNIPHALPPGFNLRVRANTLHRESGGKVLVEMVFGAAHFCVAVRESAIVEELSARAAEVMQRRGQGNQWYVDRNPSEQVDQEFCYQTVLIFDVYPASFHAQSPHSSFRS
jgi:hypothetical protein